LKQVNGGGYAASAASASAVFTRHITACRGGPFGDIPRSIPEPNRHSADIACNWFNGFSGLL
jgi:hypothetical protein